MARVAPSKTDEQSPTEHQEAASRRAAEAQTPTLDPKVRALLDALANERRGYVSRGLTNRVAQVDAVIERLKG